MPYLELCCARDFPINPGYYFETCITEIDLPRPRDITAIRTNHRYNEIFVDIWGNLREEVLKSKQQELGTNN